MFTETSPHPSSPWRLVRESLAYQISKMHQAGGLPEDGQPLNKEGAKFNDIKRTTTNNPIQSVASTALSNP
uniref:Uncharacterized protein n=2 Tax=Arabidopsis thaliana TaxID=3702 RepID=Q1G3C8_ARATH|nr:unknown protein [Arabidopsis thaliana]